MSQIQALVAGLVHNPKLLKELLRNPKQLASAAVLDSTALAKIAGLYSSLVIPEAETTGSRSGSNVQADSTAILGALSLAAITGSLVVLGTVAMVALSGDRRSNS